MPSVAKEMAGAAAITIVALTMKVDSDFLNIGIALRIFVLIFFSVS